MQFWLEIVTLLIPGFNDSDDELRRLTQFVANVSPDIPWHVTAFHGDYKMTDPANTTAAMLQRAAAIGRRVGSPHVYAGNLPGHGRHARNTHTAQTCGQLLVERYGYHVEAISSPTAGDVRRAASTSRGAGAPVVPGDSSTSRFRVLPRDVSSPARGLCRES